MPCIMARQGRYKYNYIHGYDPQLFDLEADPGEVDDLAARPDAAHVLDVNRRYLARWVEQTGDPFTPVA